LLAVTLSVRHAVPQFETITNAQMLRGIAHRQPKLPLNDEGPNAKRVGMFREFGAGFPLSREDLLKAKRFGFCFKFLER
jgi:hypothetical protein